MITEDTRNDIFHRDGYKCVACGKHMQTYNSCQIAHSIKSGKGSENHIMAYIWSKYKKDRSRRWVQDFILDNPLNLSTTCCLSCNDSRNIFFNPVERDALIDRIIEETECLKYEKMY